MSRKIKIITDTTADMQPDAAKAYDISIMPFTITFGNEIYKDGQNITVDELYKKVEETGVYPKTAAINIQEYYDEFKPWLDRGYDIIYMTISSKSSSAMNNAILAARQLGAEDRVHIIDSKHLAMSIADILIQIGDDINAGYEIDEIIKRAEEKRDRMQTMFVISTLTFLNKGGRCSNMAAFFGKMLKFHPVVWMNDGAIEIYKIKAGKVTKAVDAMFEQLEKDIKEYYIPEVYVGDSRGDDLAEYLIEKLSKYFSTEQIHRFKPKCVIATHCGPGTVGLFYDRAMRRDDLKKNKA